MARMFEAVEACRARVLLLQMPASFRASVDSLKQMESLFESVEEDDVVIALETRGASWKTADARRALRDVFKRYHVAHVTDPMKLDPVWVGEVAYFRLHGLPSYSLKYSYTNSQLKDLRRRVEKFDDADRIYIFFNNYAMYRDAWRFQLLLGEGRLPPTPFGPSSVSWTLNAFDDWPVTKTELLERCGRWRCWVEPNRTVPLREILDHFESRIYRGIEEVNTEAQDVWEQTGQPEASEIEEERSSD